MPVSLSHVWAREARCGTTCGTRRGGPADGDWCRTCARRIRYAKIPFMDPAFQMYLIDRDEHLPCPPLRQFEVMLADPEIHSSLQFSGQRIRAANVLVKLTNRIPTAIRWITYHMMTCDRTGCVDSGRFRRREFSKHQEGAGRVLVRMTSDSQDQRPVVGAADRFATQGDAWMPSASPARAIDAAVLCGNRRPRL